MICFACKKKENEKQKLKRNKKNSEKVKCIHTQSTFEWMLILQAFNMENVWKTFWKFNHFSRIFIFDFRYFNFSGSFHLADAILVFHNPNDSIAFPHASYFFERFAFFSSSFVLLVDNFPLLRIVRVWWMAYGGHNNWIHWTHKIIASALLISFDRGF